MATKNQILAVVTTAGLAGLTGVALNSTHGTPAVPQPAAMVHHRGGAPIVTRTSGATATAQPVAAKTVKHAPAQPIVTRASGAHGGARLEDD
jgi:hypothetical protein